MRINDTITITKEYVEWYESTMGHASALPVGATGVITAIGHATKRVYALVQQKSFTVPFEIAQGKGMLDVKDE